MRDRHEEMPSALLVAQEQVLRLGTGELRHEPLRLLDRHHRRVRMAGRDDAVVAQEGLEIHQRTSYRASSRRVMSEIGQQYAKNHNST